MPASKSPRPTTLHFVRHGVTENTGKLLYGQADGHPLSAFGKAQAERTAQRLMSVTGGRAAAIVSSPLQRARETAKPIARLHKLRVHTDPRLMDADVGDMTDMPLRRVLSGKQGQHIRENPVTFRFPGGESFAEIYARLTDALEDIRNEYRGKTVIVVSHGDLIDMAIADAFGTGLAQFQHVGVRPASISTVSYTGHFGFVQKVNESAHLEELEAGEVK